MLLFSRENLQSMPGAGARACERVQEMLPWHLEILCVGKDWYVATKGKTQGQVLTP